MHLLSRAFWPLLGSLVCLGSLVNAAGVLEIDVVFPRSNETYAPTEKFPSCLCTPKCGAGQTSQTLSSMVYPQWLQLRLDVWAPLSRPDLRQLLHEPYFSYSYLSIDTEGLDELFSSPFWQSCDESGDQVGIRANTTTNFSTHFTIKKGGQEVDLVAATASDQT